MFLGFSLCSSESQPLLFGDLARCIWAVSLPTELSMPTTHHLLLANPAGVFLAWGFCLGRLSSSRLVRALSLSPQCSAAYGLCWWLWWRGNCSHTRLTHSVLFIRDLFRVARFILDSNGALLMGRENLPCYLVLGRQGLALD